MTLRIEKTGGESRSITLRLAGRIEAVHLAELAAQIWQHGSRLRFDLEQVTLVDAEVVRFLIACEAGGVELQSAAPYIRAWINREQPELS